MIHRLAHLSGISFAVVYLWKIAFLLFTAQPIPSNDSFFYDGPVVNYLLHGQYCNPALAQALPIAGTDVFAAYPPLYQAVLLGWMKFAGTSALASMWLHLALLGVFMLTTFKMLEELQTSAWAVNVAGLFFLGITFHDRPDTLAHVLGLLAIYAGVRGAGFRNDGLAGESVPSQDGGIESQNHRSPPLPACGHSLVHSEWSKGTGRGGSPVHGVVIAARGRRPAFHANGWSWFGALLLLLTFATSLQIGGIYFLWFVALAMLATGLGKIQFPWTATMALLGALAGLVAWVKFGFPHLWAGFQEHAAITPSLTGLRLPRPEDVLKLVRTAPGILLVSAWLFWLVGRGRLGIGQLRKSPLMMVAVAGCLAAWVLMAGALFVLTPNVIHIANYLQPVIVGCFVAAALTSPIEFKPNRVAALLIASAVLLVSIRAIGMTTWGVLCARDVSHAEALARVNAELDATPASSTVMVSAAYLYEAARRNDVTWLHSDWPAAPGPGEWEARALRELRPARLLLTQFDYYRRYEGVLAQLQRESAVVTARIVNTARVRPPDSLASFRKVVQHVAWAPVVVELDWNRHDP